MWFVNNFENDDTFFNRNMSYLIKIKLVILQATYCLEYFLHLIYMLNKLHKFNCFVLQISKIAENKSLKNQKKYRRTKFNHQNNTISSLLSSFPIRI